MTNRKDQDTGNQEIKKNILRRLFQVIMSIVVFSVLLFASAGRIDWIFAWMYIAASLLIITANAVVFPPELISERGRKKENVEKWDRLISGLMLFPWSAIYVISGLDLRFGWSPPFIIWINICGLILYISGNILVSWAMVSNVYFSTAVRIQYDRRHKVSDGGPYQYIRHPGYLGMIVFLCATPAALGSLWALIPAGLTVVLFVIRTVFEENTLKNKLEGYKDYAEKVRYRLLPGIW